MRAELGRGGAARDAAGRAARGPRTARPNRTVFRPLAAIPNEPKEPQKSASRGMGRARHRTSSPAGRWPQRSRCHRHLFTYRRGTPSSQAFLNWTLRIQEHSSRVRHTREGGEGQGSAGHVGFIRDGSRPRPGRGALQGLGPCLLRALRVLIHRHRPAPGPSPCLLSEAARPGSPPLQRQGVSQSPAPSSEHSSRPS